jgi:hypothetical protein
MVIPRRPGSIWTGSPTSASSPTTRATLRLTSDTARLRVAAH